MPNFYNPSCEIVGVIKDLNIRHLSQFTQPVVIYYDDTSIGRVYTVTASYKHENRAKVIEFLRNVYKESTGRTDFEYTLIEDELEKIYREDRQVVNIYTLFAGVPFLYLLWGYYQFHYSIYDNDIARLVCVK